MPAAPTRCRRADLAGRVRILEVKVKPGARRSALTALPDGTWLAEVKAPPVDGKANAELIALVARAFALRQSEVEICSGAGGRHKRVQIPDAE